MLNAAIRRSRTAFHNAVALGTLRGLTRAANTVSHCTTTLHVLSDTKASRCCACMRSPLAISDEEKGGNALYTRYHDMTCSEPPPPQDWDDLSYSASTMCHSIQRHRLQQPGYQSILRHETYRFHAPLLVVLPSQLFFAAVFACLSNGATRLRLCCTLRCHHTLRHC